MALLNCLVWAGSLSSQAGEAVTPPPAYRHIEIPGIHNAFHVGEKIYSGSQPEGDEAFAALAKLGVKTIVSVDGSKPDVEAARKHGLGYVHLPFEYDGVPTNRITELAKAVQSSPGAVFVHCHHGLHRGPTAVAVICEATQGWTTNQAQAWMREAGTEPDYSELYRSAATLTKPTTEQLAAVKDLPEVAKTSSLVDAMVVMDEHFSLLKLSQKAGWKAPPGHVDITPAHQALMLWEQLREVTRTQDTAKRPEDYRVKLGEAEKATASFRQSLGQPGSGGQLDESFSRIGQSCSACHKRFRNQ